MKLLLVTSIIVAFVTSSHASLIDLGGGNWLVNSDATVAGVGNPGDGDVLSLATGTYSFQLVDPTTIADAIFTAWSPVNGGDNWKSGINIQSLTSSIGVDLTTPGNFDTPEEAFAAASSIPSILDLPSPDSLSFYFNDPFISDNRGGASVFVSTISTAAVPEPSLKFLSMIVCLGSFGWVFYQRQRRQRSI